MFVIFGFSILTFALLRPAYQLGLRELQKMYLANRVLLNSHSATWILTLVKASGLDFTKFSGRYYALSDRFIREK